MDFQFTAEHDELRQTVRKFLNDKSTEAAVRKTMVTDSGFDPDVWSQMSEQMGLPGLIIPEDLGGAGMSAVELTVVLEEMGRVLLCAPYFSTAVLATYALLQAGSDAAKKDILGQIAAGKTTATLAFSEGGWDLAGIRMEAKQDGKDWVLDGTKKFVIDGHTADTVLVVARTKEGLSLFRISGKADGVERQQLPTLDLTRKLASITFKKARAERIGAAGDLTAQLDQALTLAIVALAAEQVGGAQRCLELSTEYAKTRLQFGRPIGSYQAIKHRCADMLVAVEFAKSAAYFAAFRAADSSHKDLEAAALMAKSYCSDAYFQAANDNIQIHGGMGFTWEHIAHLYFKRAKSSSMMFGDPAHHREKLATQLGL